jgi:hypothetical protein
VLIHHSGLRAAARHAPDTPMHRAFGALDDGTSDTPHALAPPLPISTLQRHSDTPYVQH